jgi:chondroitin AC lyase
MTYELNSNGLTANKSYFFFNDIMISLGTNINSNSSKEVYTTVNQTFLGDNVDIYIKNSKQKHPKYFNIVDNNINKIIHNQLLYYFPKSYNIKVMGSNKKGKWSDINVSGSKNDENYDILSIVISHGQKFKNESYSYIVAPFTKSNEDYIKQIEILANDNNIQAVVDNEINMAQIVFLKPTELNLKGVKIKVDKPIVVLIENFNSKNNILHIVDPTQELGDVSINYNNREYNIQLPKGGLLGTALKII